MEKTILHDRHLALKAQMVDFGGWDMPIQYPAGILQEHLATRKRAGLFDVSHMGRFRVAGRGALPFLQRVLTNNAAALAVGKSHYSILANANGGAIDDAYLYRFTDGEFLLVVNAANRQKDWNHLQAALAGLSDVVLEDQSEALAMISLQGPESLRILTPLIEAGSLPEAKRNALSSGAMFGQPVLIARTGYTGEPLGFELFVPAALAGRIWDALCEGGAAPVGLGARDTLRLEAGLPLYGHEFGMDRDGREIPILAVGAAKIAVSFAPEKGEFLGKAALQKQFDALQAFKQADFSRIAALPRRVRLLALTGKGIARAGDRVFQQDTPVGYVTSGTMTPYWKTQGDGDAFRLLDETGKRAIALALLESSLPEGSLPEGAALDVEIRGKRTEAVIVRAFMRAVTPNCAAPVFFE